MRTGLRRVFQASVAAFILLFVLGLTREARAQTWIELAPAGSPPDPIYDPKPAQYDAANNRLIVFFPGNPPYGGFGNQVWVPPRIGATYGDKKRSCLSLHLALPDGSSRRDAAV